MSLSGYNLGHLRDINRGTVLRLLHWQPGLSRRELARQTGLDASTISHIIEEFLVGGLVRERGVVPPATQPRRGRRQIGLEVLASGAYAIGVHLGVRSLRLAACDLQGQIAARRARLLEPGAPPEVVLDDIVRLVRSLMNDAVLQNRRLVGIGIGVVAFLDPITGVVQSAPSLGWGEVDLAGRVRDQLGLPVLVEHHARAMALAEQWFGSARHTPNFALVNIDSSVGIGLVINGQLVRGNNARAGQVAHMVVAEGGPLCSCGRRGCLVMLASYRALAAQVTDLVACSPDAPLAQAIVEHPAMPAEYVVFELAARGDPASQHLIEEMARQITDVMTHLVALVDPTLLVLAASNATHAALLVQRVRPRLAQLAPPMPHGTPHIITSPLDRDLAVLGGAALMFERFVDDLSAHLLGDLTPMAVTE